MPHDVIEFIPPEELKYESAVATLDESVDWGILITGVDQAWQETKGAGISIAVLDTGIFSHTDLEGQVLNKFDTTGSGVEPAAAHGTHVAGIIAAAANDKGIIGVAPESKLYSVKVLGAGHGSFQNVIDGLKICETLDCQIINMSLGIQSEPPPEFHTQIKRLYNMGKIMVAAAGNDSGAVNWPAAYPEVIAIAAINKDQTLAKFASYGPQVDATAPGVDVYSTILDNQYGTMSGSSQASPFFCGIIALLMSYSKQHPEKIQFTNFDDVLKYLDELCDPTTLMPHSGTLADVGFGVPHIGNNMPWRQN